MKHSRFIGLRSGKMIVYTTGAGRSNVIGVNFEPIDQSGALYAIALAQVSVRDEIRKQRKAVRQQKVGAR